MATIKTKQESVQVKMKQGVMDEVRNLFQSQGMRIVDCREDVRPSGATKFTLFVRNDEADCKISFVSKADKKSPFYDSVDEILDESLCDDED